MCLMLNPIVEESTPEYHHCSQEEQREAEDFLKRAMTSEFKEHYVLKLADNEKLEPEELERLSVDIHIVG